ncbi:conserved hypothetical protein [Bathymodiolus platifrons methanotrophic gill symbiont]|uniref:hypothetical protein n=1 Tax=Bathymodiolus platifrons methanotrophic gill symbiont TaxID=113268 RepID=UPI000B410FDE|nr:hypothetical protein [Bathymodiolus platifrons methanotrophic gill symbiont]TXL13486.1 hypothetical protein BMR05_11400 [Methylococcaceae bacterium HT4]TXL14476.1 hypothetical protein BMR04_13215 [Methylococcaceae bacterium HT3]TXL17782.1 hypothetical protein BMR06_14475 [Methylococcaceae bacterium HT5]GAW87812.1 conserved hypothetical protein [Bathymodiolus platifrons methanotrophic gill symbiont]
MVKAKISRKPRLSQGDIIRDVEHIEYVQEKSGIIEVSKIVFPLCIVLTQDCDLAQDYKFRWSKKQTPNEDKWLLSVILAPIYNVEHIYTGEHLSEIGMSMTPINRRKTQGQNLRNNETPRYHYLEFPENIPIVPSVVDFKHYFSANVAYLKSHKTSSFVCQVSELFREDISQRFSSYLSRIGLP